MTAIVSVRTDDHRYQVVPPLAADDLANLRASIEEHGYDDAYPVVVDEEGYILDGHHRAMICDDLCIEFEVSVKVGLTESEKRLYAVSRNIARRQLTELQKAVLGKQIEPDIKARAADRQAAAGEHHGRGMDSEIASDVLSEAIEDKGDTRDQVAQEVGLSSGIKYQRYKAVLDELAKEPDGEQLMEHVRSGDWDIKEARKELKHRHPERTEFPKKAGQSVATEILPNEDLPKPNGRAPKSAERPDNEPWFKAKNAGSDTVTTLVVATREIRDEIDQLKQVGIDIASLMGDRRVSAPWNKALHEARVTVRLIRETIKGTQSEETDDIKR